MVEAVTGVPRQTIRIWKMQPWWNDLVKEIQQSEDQELDGKLSKIIDRSLDAVNERLTNGDFILDSKTGTIKRVPVKMRDAHRVTTDLLDKRNLLRGKPTSITERISTEDVLKNLAQQFQEFTKFKNSKLIEHTLDPDEGVEDAVHDEWPPGLCAGEQGVQLPPLDEEEESGKEQGACSDGEEDWTEHNGGRGSHTASLERGFHESTLQLESTLPQTQSLFSSK